MKNIVVLDEMTMRGDMRRPSFPHQWLAYPQTVAAEVPERIKNAHVVITNKVPITAAAISSNSNLELIAVAATGVDNIDLVACRQAKVAVCNVRNYANRSVAEHAMALIFALARGIVIHHQETVAGKWSESPVFSPNMGEIVNLQDMQIGLLGSGALGQATAQLAKSIGMHPVFWQRDKQDDLLRLPLAELLASSDIVSLHCPLTAETKNIINRDTLAMLKPGALLINTARGGLMDSAAVVEMLQNGHLGGVAIDVLPVEPPPPNEPLLCCRHPQLIISPHIAWASRQSLKVFHEQIGENIEKFYAGTPQNLIE
ncbi:MAG: NAD(P)-dependent oxidoreductase [Gammaproteobacteria bacterium WSBS_2016_MAG_OTU1]